MQDITREEVQKRLVDAIHMDELTDEAASAFHDRIVELKKTDPVFYDMLWEYETLADYFMARYETLNPAQEILLKDMQMEQSDIVDDFYDHAEDRVKDELKLKDSARITKVMQKSGIMPVGTLPKTTRPTDDMIEEFFIEAFRAYDDHKAAAKVKLLQIRPMQAFNRGEEIIEAYRKEKGITYDETDFMALFDERFEEDRLDQLLLDKVKEVIHYNRHYELEPVDEEDDAGGSAEDNDRLDAILVPKGDMRDQPFGYVSELMSEYTGRRLLSYGEDGEQLSFWSTYADDFQDMILSYAIAKLDQVIVELKEQQPYNWEAFCKASYLSKEEREDTEQILAKCDRINYGIGAKVEEAWSRLCDAKIK